MKFHRKALTSILTNDLFKFNEPTGKTIEDGLVEVWKAVFEFEKKFYAFEYRKGSYYYRNQCDDEIEPFENEIVECQEVVARQVTTTVYDPCQQMTDIERIRASLMDPDSSNLYLPRVDGMILLEEIDRLEAEVKQFAEELLYAMKKHASPLQRELLP